MNPVAFLHLSPFAPSENVQLPPASAAPRLVKQLPPNFTDSQLFDIFRPYGALSSVRTSGNFGRDAGLVEFWREEEAKVAEENMHCAEVGGSSIVVQVYHPRRSSGGPGGGEFNVAAPAFVPSGSVLPYPQQQHSPGPYPFQSPRRTSSSFVHGPGQQVQYAPPVGPGSNSHSGLIDPCNLFCKVLICSFLRAIFSCACRI